MMVTFTFLSSCIICTHILCLYNKWGIHIIKHHLLYLHYYVPEIHIQTVRILLVIAKMDYLRYILVEFYLKQIWKNLRFL